MMNVKRIAALAAVLAAVATVGTPPARAQQGQGRPGRGMMQGLSLVMLPPTVEARLKLSEEQKTKLMGIRTAFRQEMQTLRQSSQGDQQAALQKFQAARQKSEGEAETVLTSEQKTQWTALKTENEQFQGLGRAGVALAGVEALTDDQKGKLKTLAEETGGKRRTVFQDAVQGGDRAAAREKIQALETESDAAVRKLLTADQVKQYDATLAGLPRLGQRRPGNN